MPVFCGTDLIRVSRIKAAVERRGEPFLRRVFHESELMDCGWPEKPRMESLAGRFAAKEAVAKALGTGIGKNVRWTDIRVATPGPSQRPIVTLEGGADAWFQNLTHPGKASISVSISHDGDLAIAMCVISSDR